MIHFITENGQGVAAEATRDADTVRVTPDVLRRVFGWELKPQGLCKDDVCIPIPQRGDLVADGRVNLAGFAQLLDRPLVVDAAEAVVHLGESARQRGAALASLRAPDFTLPDLDGRLHSLADYRGKRVLLVAHASW
jgi:hypothetical protein